MISEAAKIRFAVVGCGRIGKRHIQVLQLHPQAEVVAMVDQKQRLELDLPSTGAYFSSLDEFLSSGPKADIVTIATPNGLHATQAIQCMDNGLHVLIEKPLALHAKDAKKILDKSISSGLHVFTVMQNRYAKSAIWLKELLDRGELGEIFLVQVNCFWNRSLEYYLGHEWHGKKSLDGGTLFTQFAHFVDMLYWLFGDIVNIKGRLANFAHKGITEFEDTGILHFEFEKGGMGSLNFTTAVWDKNFDSSLTVIASKGTIKISGQYMQNIEYCHTRNSNLADYAGKQSNDQGDNNPAFDQHFSVITHVIEVLRDREENSLDVQNGFKVVDIIERMNNQLKFSAEKTVV